MYRKEWTYDRESKRWAMYLDGRFVGYAATPYEAETRLDELVFGLLQSGIFSDGGAE
jgi:hypothetical protein